VKRLAAALVLLAVAGPVSACAIGPGPVVSHGNAPVRSSGSPDSTTQQLSRSHVSSATDLVLKYLNAAADKPETQLETLRSFMRDKSWKPSGELNIYRVGAPKANPQNGDTYPVEVPMQRIGVLRDHRIDPVFEEQVTKNFSVVDSPEGFLLKDAPTELMMSETQLASSCCFERRFLYFWDKAGTRLIPDMLYIPSYLSVQQKAKLLLEAFFEPGPSNWLAPAVKLPTHQMPLRTLPVYNESNGTLVVDLPNQLSEAEQRALYTQLDRTLKPNRASVLQLKIQGVPVDPEPADPFDDSRLAARFAVQQGKVMRPESDPSPVPLADDVNSDVAWAQFSRGEQSVALVRMQGNVQHFYIGPVAGPKPVTVTGRAVEQAMWLGGEGKAALVLSDHKLFEVVPGEPPRVTQLAVPQSGAVTSFSLTPDGCVAVVIDGKLYLAVVYHNGDALAMTQPKQVPTGLDQVQHVALGRNEMIVAGVGQNDGQASLLLVHMNVDGSGRTVWKSYQASQQISHLVIDYRTGWGYFDYGSAQVLTSSGASQYGRSGLSPAPSASTAPPPPLYAVSFEG
jgi:hypothetical protein